MGMAPASHRTTAVTNVKTFVPSSENRPYYVLLAAQKMDQGGRNISASHSLNLAGMFLHYSVDTATPKKYQNWPTFLLNLRTRDLIKKGRGRPKEYERGALQSRSAKSRFGKIAL